MKYDGIEMYRDSRRRKRVKSASSMNKRTKSKTRRRKKVMAGGRGYSYSITDHITSTANQGSLNALLNNLRNIINIQSTNDHFAYKL